MVVGMCLEGDASFSLRQSWYVSYALSYISIQLTPIQFDLEIRSHHAVPYLEDSSGARLIAVVPINLDINSWMDYYPGHLDQI